MVVNKLFFDLIVFLLVFISINLFVLYVFFILLWLKYVWLNNVVCWLLVILVIGIFWLKKW